MKYKCLPVLKILFFVTCFSQIAFGQTIGQHKNSPLSFVDSLFTKENYIVEVLDFEYPKDIQLILLKFQKSMAENKEWAEEYVSKNYKPGEGLPYHENFGVTKEEYQKIKDIDKSPPALVIKSTASIKVKRDSYVLSFQAGEQDIEFISALKINLKNGLVVFFNDSIPFSREINAPGSTPFGAWHGYSWRREISNIGEKDNLKIDSLVSKIVEIDFGKIASDNKILLRLIYKDVYKGSINTNLNFVCYLK